MTIRHRWPVSSVPAPTHLPWLPHSPHVMRGGKEGHFVSAEDYETLRAAIEARKPWRG